MSLKAVSAKGSGQEREQPMNCRHTAGTTANQILELLLKDTPPQSF